MTASTESYPYTAMATGLVLHYKSGDDYCYASAIDESDLVEEVLVHTRSAHVMIVFVPRPKSENLQLHQLAIRGDGNRRDTSPTTSVPDLGVHAVMFTSPPEGKEWGWEFGPEPALEIRQAIKVRVRVRRI